MDTWRDYNFTKEIITNTLRLRLLSNGIIHYTYLPNAEVNEIEHQINHNAVIELVGKDSKHPTIIDSDEFILITPEARKLIRKLESIVPISARALIVNSLSQRFLANFYIKFHKPIVPTKIFNNYEEAFQWLVTINKSSATFNLL